jgi:PII-like signaling protein
VNVGGGEALKLVFYFGEHDRHRGRFLSEQVLEIFARRGFEAAVLLRGAEGFGAAQRLRADRLLSLSEDLPLVAVAVGAPAAAEAAAAEIAEIAEGGLLTLERARLAGANNRPAQEPHEETKLTLFAGRRSRRRGLPAHVAAIETLSRHGVAGATALLGVDGAASGRRSRARFFSANESVPTLVVAVGERERIAAAVAELEREEEPPVALLEAVTVCRRDGRALAVPRAGGPAGPAWSKLSVYCSEGSEHRGRPLYMSLIRRLREEGAAGATALRGVWGYHGDHAPHGERLLALRRHVPILVTVVDTAPRSERWFEIAAAVTAETGLLTAELVPRFLTLE